MNDSWIYKPVVFFGKRINILFAAITSVPVWLIAHTYLENTAVHDDEAVATGITICVFAGIFSGRYIAQAWGLHTIPDPRRLTTRLAVFIIACVCLLVLHADFPFAGTAAINLLLFMLPLIAVSLATGILIKVVRALAEEKLNTAQRSAAQRESELKLLQSQLSPHFLFNTLNNIYGLSLSQHEKVPPLLLKLSELLRYSVYDSNETFVPLKSEIEYITNYIEFEKIRLGDRLILETEIELPADTKAVIAPMMLIIFIENAFKHSKNTVDEKIFISISVRIWSDLILFSVKNSRGKPEKRFDKSSGFGLDNVHKRLELLYPGAHQLDIQENDREYAVMLRVKKERNL